MNLEAKVNQIDQNYVPSGCFFVTILILVFLIDYMGAKIMKLDERINAIETQQKASKQ